MDLNTDFKDLLKLFNEETVEYVIVGAFALAYHGAPRFTGHIDFLVKPGLKNGQKIIQALEKFGFSLSGLSSEDFMKEDVIIQLGLPPSRIDLITSISGVTWEEAEQDCVSDVLQEIPVRFLGKTTFIQNKKATGRSKDLADIESITAL